MHRVNAVPAAVKVEQETTDTIRELHRCSCFVSEEGQSVYPLIPTMKARASSLPNVKNADILDKSKRIKTMLQGMFRESAPSMLKLFDSIVLDESEDDYFLRLWQAVEDTRGHLGYPQLWNSEATIAGKRTPRELNDYRNRIAHWYTGRIDYQFLNELQYTAMELMRRKFRQN